MPVSDEARELARKAKAELIRRGRYIGDFYPYSDDEAPLADCKVCILGAISAADAVGRRQVHPLDLTLCSPSSTAEEVVVELAERIGRKVFTRDEFDYPVYDWNVDLDTVASWHDRDTTTDDDVYRLLDGIAGDALSEPSELAVQGAT